MMHPHNPEFLTKKPWYPETTRVCFQPSGVGSTPVGAVSCRGRSRRGETTKCLEGTESAVMVHPWYPFRYLAEALRRGKARPCGAR